MSVSSVCLFNLYQLEVSEHKYINGFQTNFIQPKQTLHICTLHDFQIITPEKVGNCMSENKQTYTKDYMMSPLFCQWSMDVNVCVFIEK